MVLDQGKIVEKGKHQELLEKRGYYYDLWIKQVGDRQKATLEKPLFLNEPTGKTFGPLTLFYFNNACYTLYLHVRRLQFERLKQNKPEQSPFRKNLAAVEHNHVFINDFDTIYLYQSLSVSNRLI